MGVWWKLCLDKRKRGVRQFWRSQESKSLRPQPLWCDMSLLRNLKMLMCVLHLSMEDGLAKEEFWLWLDGKTAETEDDRAKCLQEQEAFLEGKRKQAVEATRQSVADSAAGASNVECADNKQHPSAPQLQMVLTHETRVMSEYRLALLTSYFEHKWTSLNN